MVQLFLALVHNSPIFDALGKDIIIDIYKFWLLIFQF